MLLSNSNLLLLLAPFALASPHAKRAAVNDCLASAAVPQATPGTANFTQGIKPFNLRVPFTPVALAQPTTVSQVQAAVKCGEGSGVTVSPKSGGHSYASHGLGGEDGHLCIDMRWFNNFTVDMSSGIASIGPGARLGNVAQALYTQAKRAISHGTCPGVGAGGLTLHGGYGFSSHTHGLSLDNLIEAQIALANSSVVTASATQNPDLFWALRGAGSSFGVVTNFKFQTFAAPDSNVVFSFYLSWTQSQAKTALAALQDYAMNTKPAEMNLRIFINGFSASMSGVYYGSTANFQTAIQPLMTAFGTSASSGNPQTKGWLDTLTSYSNGALTTPFNYDTHETFFSKSLMTPQLSNTAIGALVDFWFNTAKTITRDWYLIIDCHGGKYSAISNVSADATSYAHRGAIFKMEFYDRVDSGTYPSNGFSFLNGWIAAIQNAQSTTQQLGMYINYADPTLNASQAHAAYWLDHYSRLSTIKTAFDPNKLFSNPQAINS